MTYLFNKCLICQMRFRPDKIRQRNDSVNFAGRSLNFG